MAFRDENEALRARADAAEQRAARAEDEREELEAQLQAARSNDAADAARIAELEARLARLEGARRPSAKATPKVSRVPLVLALAGIVMGAGVAGYLSLSSRSSPPASVSELPGRPAAVVDQTLEAAEVRAPVSPLERVRLAGVVRSVDGVEGLEAGAGCVVDHGLSEPGIASLQVRCGTPTGVVTVFDGSEATEAGIVQSSDQTMEGTPPLTGVVRSMEVGLTGQWSGPQAQIQVQPGLHSARVWRAGIGARDVLLHLESFAGSTGEPTGASAMPASVALGTVARLARRGPVPAALGELENDCVLRSEPALGEPLNVRLLVTCGPRILYGAGNSGWNRTSAVGGVLGPVEDVDMSPADTDPALSYDGEILTLAEPEWRLVFDVEPHPACTLAEGTWVGTLRERDGALTGGVRLEGGVLTLPDGTEVSGEPTMRCHEGASFWLGDEGHRALDGRFGPEFATFVGWLPTGELVDLYRVAP